MKYLLLLIAFISFPAFSWECPQFGNSTDVSTHWHAATDVIFGRVKSGSIVEDPAVTYDQIYEFEVFHTLKGKPESGKFNFQVEKGPGIDGLMIGQSYILFFYSNSKRIDFCSIQIELSSHINDLVELKFSNSRSDVWYSRPLKELLDLWHAQP
ncbi:hypothetical protein [Microbulbifer sp. THAF38]|uniref:hypothetical protein n=1 Tax=Microbulbifer sp. THAF38 TaxID=2587856 RepID=UPI0012684B5D|nr:hypothetical protein [Microbulbifer sp. THAF38]QFT54452.1 hypothetical protein FIU95_07785 [Microbulbifer sp. THAF38]